MVLYIDFEWETEPLKMALSKNFTLPEKCKNHRSAPTVQCWSDSFFDSKLFGSSLISQRDWRGPLLAPPPAPPPRAPEARQHANSCGERSSLLQMKKRRKQQKGKKRRHTEWKSLCHFFSKKTCFSVKISVFWLFVSFLCVFQMNAAVCLFHIDSFFFFFSLHTPPSSPHSTPQNPPGENRSQWGHMHKKDKNKNWRTSVGGSGGEPVMIRWAGKRHQKKTKMTRRGRRTLTLYHLKFFFCFCLGRHGDMLGKRWANRHGGWVVLKGGKKKQGRGES